MVPLPKHITLSLRHNPHAGDYTPLETWLEHYLLAAEAGGETRDEAIAPADLAAIRASGDVWELSWCPTSPVGSCSVVAATFERALQLAGVPSDPAFYLDRLDLCRCGRRRGDHEGSQPQPCPDTGCVAFVLVEAHDPRARPLEVRSAVADELAALRRRIADLEAAASQRASDLAKVRSFGEAEKYIVTELWKHMTDEQRLELIDLGCRHCGSLDPRCYCQRDD